MQLYVILKEFLISIFRNEIFGLAKDWPDNQYRSWNYLEKDTSSSFGLTGPYQVV